MHGSTLAGKVRNLKSYISVLESTLAMEGSTLARNTKYYFLFCVGEELTPEEIESTLAQEGSTPAFTKLTPELLTDSNGQFFKR